ncbi:DUF4833 domain-containing protein [Pedobacter gandavensis]|uniref:DUF4833 domain-containing protein n=1 Tax=Pedobacter gandavensis TaxID=2679963 RepID=UPI00292D48C3|nr:DUF4833 domain-containing protein [Pedobacter gandavensis]
MTSIIFTKISRSCLAVFIGLFTFLTVNAQTADRSNPSPLKFPTPKGIKNQLFYLQRDPNTNTIIYELNVNAKGEVNRAEPVLVYWLRYDDNGVKKDLSYIQRKFAYGIQTKEIAKDQFEIRFVSHKKIPMYLMQSKEDQKFHVYVTVNNKKIELSKIFVRIEGGSFWLPNVKYVELSGINTATDTPVVERIKV